MEMLNYMFRDESFKKKFIGLAILMFIWYFLAFYAPMLTADKNNISHVMLGGLLALASFFFSFTYCGYSMSCIRNLWDDKENKTLPDIKIWDNFVFGFRMFLGIFLFTIAVGIILGILFAVLKIAALLIGIALFLLYLIYYIALSCIFAKKNEIPFMFKLGEAINLVNKGAGQYFKSFLILIII